MTLIWLLFDDNLAKSLNYLLLNWRPTTRHDESKLLIFLLSHQPKCAFPLQAMIWASYRGADPLVRDTFSAVQYIGEIIMTPASDDHFDPILISASRKPANHRGINQNCVLYILLRYIPVPSWCVPIFKDQYNAYKFSNFSNQAVHIQVSQENHMITAQYLLSEFLPIRLS